MSVPGGTIRRMTEDTAAGEPPEDQYPDLSDTKDWFGAPDRTLQEIADFVNSFGHGASVTLVLPGSVVSGDAASVDSFYQEAADQHRELMTRTDDENIQTLIDAFARMLYERHAEEYVQRRERENMTPPTMIRHLHLRDVTIRTPAGTINTPRLRVLLSQVSAWYPGRPTTI